MPKVSVAGVVAPGPADACWHHSAQPTVVGGLHVVELFGHVVQVALEVVIGHLHETHGGRLPATDHRSQSHSPPSCSFMIPISAALAPEVGHPCNDRHVDCPCCSKKLHLSRNLGSLKSRRDLKRKILQVHQGWL